MTARTESPRLELGPKPWRLTHEEYHRLGDLGFFREKRVQLIRGEVIEMSAMGSRHTVLVRVCADALEAAFGPGSHTRQQAPLKFLGSEPEPDVAVVPGKPMDFYAAHPSSALLVVEVSDATLRNDLTVKAELYAEAGIADYWVLDLDANVVHVLRDPRPIGAGGYRYYSVTVLSPGDSVAPLAAPNSLVRVADLLP